MARPLRIEYPGAWYHVMNRGRRGEQVFLEEADYQTFLELLMESVELWNLRIAAYCQTTTISWFKTITAGQKVKYDQERATLRMRATGFW